MSNDADLWVYIKSIEEISFLTLVDHKYYSIVYSDLSVTCACT